MYRREIEREREREKNRCWKLLSRRSFDGKAAEERERCATGVGIYFCVLATKESWSIERERLINCRFVFAAR